MPRKTLKQVGREVLTSAKANNIAAASAFREGEAVQFYKDGWRYGHVKALGTKLRTGMVQVEHPITGTHWIKASDVRTLAALKACRASTKRTLRGAQAHQPTRRISR